MSDGSVKRVDHVREIVRLFEGVHGRYDMHSLFSDCMEAVAISLANAVDLFQREAREGRYMEIVKRHGAETMTAFARVLSEVVAALEDEPQDILGSVFGELELGNARAGQFFTPYHLSRLAAGITCGNKEYVQSLIESRGYVTACEPACGSGGMVIALAEEMRSLGFNPQSQLHVTAVDVDPRAVHMAFIQLSLMHIPAIIVIGNALSLEARSWWFTPAHILGGWSYRIRRTPEGPTQGESEPPKRVDIQPVAVGQAPQLALF